MTNKVVRIYGLEMERNLCIMSFPVNGILDLQINSWRIFLMENHRKSKIKKSRKMGFRARGRTKEGRKIFNRKRRAGRSIN